MINVLLPCMGKSVFFKDMHFPKLMIEIDNSTMLEHLIRNFQVLEDSVMTFVMGNEECKSFHIDDAANILTDNKCNIIRLKHQTKGALCTCLMAIDYIDNDEPLIIANTDQIIDIDFNTVIQSFRERNTDAGLITFSNIHPRWSYAKVVNGEVVEVAEKKPLSDRAIAGFYYFKSGKLFVEAAKQAIRKETCVDDIFYISASINELILIGKKVVDVHIAKEEYHSFYSPEKIKEYERSLS